MRFWYHVCWWIARIGLFFWHPVFHVEGRAHIPAGSCVFCANHSGMADPIWILLALPEKRMIRIMAKQELRRVPFVGWVMEKFRVIFVNRGAHDIAAYQQCIDALEQELLAQNAQFKNWTCSEEMMKRTKDGKALYLHCLPADINDVSCKDGEVEASVFDRYRTPLYKEASYKPYIIAAMIFLAKVKDPQATLKALEERGIARWFQK